MGNAGGRSRAREGGRPVRRLLVNNAAWVRYQGIAEIQSETVDRMLDIGFKAIIWGMQAAAEVMDTDRGGAIVNIASVAGYRSTPNSIVYSGIKAGSWV